MATAKQQTKQQHFNLRQCVTTAFNRYIASLGDQEPMNVYDLFRAEAEKALFGIMIHRTRDNECKISRQLNIARGTLRTRRKELDLPRIRKRKNSKKAETAAV